MMQTWHLETCCRPWTWWCNNATVLAGLANMMMMMIYDAITWTPGKVSAFETVQQTKCTTSSVTKFKQMTATIVPLSRRPDRKSAASTPRWDVSCRTDQSAQPAHAALYHHTDTTTSDWAHRLEKSYIHSFTYSHLTTLFRDYPGEPIR